MLLDTEALYDTCLRTLTVENLSVISMEIEGGGECRLTWRLKWTLKSLRQNSWPIEWSGMESEMEPGYQVEWHQLESK